MQRIQVTFDDDLDPNVATKLIQLVVEQGRISQSSDGTKKYCWATRIEYQGQDYMVFTSDHTKYDNFRISKA